MNFTEIIEQIKSELQKLAEKEEANQKEQAQIIKDIEQLKLEIEQKYHRQSELDREALELCRLTEELMNKQEKIAKIKSFSEKFQDLQAEFQDNQDLLDTLYSSISAIAKINPKLSLEIHNNYLNQESFSSDQNWENIEEYTLSIETIKAKLPHAEKLYQQLVAQHLEQYHTYQNLIINGLDLIWFSVAFIAFGKESYKKMCLKYHPDRQGSAQAMQLINTAWEISQEHIKSL